MDGRVDKKELLASAQLALQMARIANRELDSAVLGLLHGRVCLLTTDNRASHCLPIIPTPSIV